MRNIINYCVVQNLTTSGLSKDVRDRISDGWQPYEGLVIGGGYYTQAMVRYGDKIGVHR